MCFISQVFRYELNKLSAPIWEVAHVRMHVLSSCSGPPSPSVKQYICLVHHLQLQCQDHRPLLKKHSWALSHSDYSLDSGGQIGTTWCTWFQLTDWSSSDWSRWRDLSENVEQGWHKIRQRVFPVHGLERLPHWHQFSGRGGWRCIILHQLQCVLSTSSTARWSNYPNNKPWDIPQLKDHLKGKQLAFRKGDNKGLQAAQRENDITGTSWGTISQGAMPGCVRGRSRRSQSTNNRIGQCKLLMKPS